MKRFVLILTFLISPGLFAATATSADNSNASTSVERKHKKKKKHAKPEASAEIKDNELSVNAVKRAEANAKQSMDSEMRNNANAGAVNEVSGSSNTPTVYPKSASPDVRDSYNTSNRTGSSTSDQGTVKQDETRHTEKSTGSSAVDSLSGDSSAPSQENKH